MSTCNISKYEFSISIFEYFMTNSTNFPNSPRTKSEVEEILFKLATNDHSDEAVLLTSKILALMGCLPLPKGYV